MLLRAVGSKLRVFGIVGISTIIALVAVVVITGSDTGKRGLAGVPSLTAVDDVSAPQVIHGALRGDRLDDPAEKSLELAEAVALAGLDLYLPDPRVAGRVVKVVPNETVEDPSGGGRIGLMVLYDTGVKLIVEPGVADLKERNESMRGSLPFRDGRELPWILKTVAGRPTLVAEFGIQYQGDAEIAQPADMMWNMAEATYWLRAPVEGPREATDRGLSKNPRYQPIGVDDLIRIANSMAPARERL